ATKDEAIVETEKMLNVYTTFAEEFMAMPVVKGLKTEAERFAGALETYCIEAMMQDGKALQAGTSHFLGQNFAHAFDVKFTDKEGKLEHVWATSWGVSTRLIGALIMTHSDDEGLVLPPLLAPIQVVFIPIYRKAEEKLAIDNRVDVIMAELKAKGVSCKYDDDDNRRPGWKFAEYEAKGVPLRVAIGPRDLENNQAEVARRDTKEKTSVSLDGFADYLSSTLDQIQVQMFDNALEFRNKNTSKVDSYDEFKTRLNKEGGFFLAHWDGTKETEAKIKTETQATIRCIPLDSEEEAGVCMYSGKPSNKRVIFAKAY
ncbi:MAG: prolyl-tRNA synthetase, partial [Lentimonas sp.]